LLEMSLSQEMRDNVVLQTAADVRVRVPLFHTADACPGAVTAYILRRIAYRAGAYAPGIQESMFHDLTTLRSGKSLPQVQRWMQGHVDIFHGHGYRLYFRFNTETTEVLSNWVREGRGYRGAVLSTEFSAIHPKADGTPTLDHAVGLAMDRLSPNGEDELVMVDPFPGAGNPDTGPVLAELDAARKPRKFNSLAYYWVGWS
jgi:hypothetical protein